MFACKIWINLEIQENWDSAEVDCILYSPRSRSFVWLLLLNVDSQIASEPLHKFAEDRNLYPKNLYPSLEGSLNTFWFRNVSYEWWTFLQFLNHTCSSAAPVLLLSQWYVKQTLSSHLRLWQNLNHYGLLKLRLHLASTVVIFRKASLECPHLLIMYMAFGRCWFMFCSIGKKDHAVLVIASFAVYRCWALVYTGKRWEWLHLLVRIYTQKEYRNLTEKIWDTCNSGVH